MNLEELAEVFRRNLRNLRREHRVSQLELARRTGIFQPQLSALERGDTNPSLSTISKLAMGLGVPPYLLLFEPLEEPDRRNGKKLQSVS